MVSDLNVCSRKGLSERFDSTIGAGSVLMPFGGKYQMTPTQAMAAKIPVLGAETTTCSVMSYGYNPFITEKNPFLGAYTAVVESVAKVIAAGGNTDSCYLTFQEYFERLGTSPERWGKPLAALLGALVAQINLGIAAIGGKDSMSGSFENIDVPPTLVSFAVSIGKTGNIISPEFKKAGSKVVFIPQQTESSGLLNNDKLLENFKLVQQLIADDKVLSAWTPAVGGIAEGIFKMCIGNGFGFEVDPSFDEDLLFDYQYGSFILELAEDIDAGVVLGKVIEEPVIRTSNLTMDLAELTALYENKLEEVYPCRIKTEKEEVPQVSFEGSCELKKPEILLAGAKPKVLIPVFPGTNCEYDTARAMELAGADPVTFVIRNGSAQAVSESVEAFAKQIEDSQIIFIPGGFSGGDEPEGSGKFITAFFRNPAISDGVNRLLKERDGLMSGICNGFQALIKLGLVQYGEIRDLVPTDPTLTFNTIGRHQSMIVRTRVASVKSPWLSLCQVGDIHNVAISHGEGRFIANDEWLAKLAENGQIATQYVNEAGMPTMDIHHNPNGSVWAIEGITSPDGRVFGKMGHSERVGKDLYRNVPGQYENGMFAAAVRYFE